MNRTPSARLVAVLALALVPVISCATRSSEGGHYAEIHGIRMYYELHGSGPPLLLLHGGGGSGMQFEHQIPTFAATHRLIVPDSRAQGRSTDAPGQLSYHVMAEDVITLLDKLRIQRVDVMGWSDGGNIGLDMAMNHPSRVGHLVTFGANFRADGMNAPDLAWLQTANADSFGPGMREGWTKLNPQPDRYADVMTKLIGMWRTQPQWTDADLGKIRARCLICAGEHDLVRPDHTAALARAIPGAEIWIVPGASHSAMMERPDLVNAKVLEFLAR